MRCSQHQRQRRMLTRTQTHLGGAGTSATSSSANLEGLQANTFDMRARRQQSRPCTRHHDVNNQDRTRHQTQPMPCSVCFPGRTAIEVSGWAVLRTHVRTRAGESMRMRALRSCLDQADRSAYSGILDPEPASLACWGTVLAVACAERERAREGGVGVGV